MGRSGLILISFSTVSCCPLQFNAVCTCSSIFKLYLIHILTLYLHVIWLWKGAMRVNTPPPPHTHTAQRDFNNFKTNCHRDVSVNYFLNGGACAPQCIPLFPHLRPLCGTLRAMNLYLLTNFLYTLIITTELDRINYSQTLHSSFFKFIFLSI